MTDELGAECCLWGFEDVEVGTEQKKVNSTGIGNLARPKENSMSVSVGWLFL
jgi:hypothetical protein